MKEIFKILVVDDEMASRESMEMLLSGVGYQVSTAESANKALEILEKEYYPLVITDIMMPGVNGIDFLREIKDIYKETIEVIMVTGYGSIEIAVQTIKMGAFEYFIKGHDLEELLLYIKKAKSIIELKAMHNQNRNNYTRQFLMTSKNEKMNEVWDIVDRVAKTDANILITGETGVGKEIVAQKIHQMSNRSTKLFTPINCQNYPDNLIESELFGYEKGAFTGAANKRIGKIEASNGGTLFLDEIGDMSMPTQVALLRTIESRKIERIGSNSYIDVDFRLVSATNRELDKEVKSGTFREDFLYRINTIEIKIPSLRERREDILDLVEFFIKKYEEETGKVICEIDKETKKFLLEYNYAGNVRELRNMIERMVILSSDGVLSLRRDKATSSEKMNFGDSSGTVIRECDILPYKEAKQNFERKYIQNVLKVCDNNISKTAELIGISRRQLFNKITEYEIDTKSSQR
ncbi:MAG: sigma-54 dependent transcriptional regulator [Clostridioides sp.]|jgi:DNA-binding NtrC family response regulator|nr:sigma-54 dependent transcriptional regulator [Clostridioides sp.]